MFKTQGATTTDFNQLNIANTVLVANQDPSVTPLIEATAELRHGEHIAEMKSEAERLHDSRLQAVRVQAEQEHEKKVSQVVGILQERMHAEEARRRLGEQSEEYRTVLDSRLRQVTASKDKRALITVVEAQGIVIVPVSRGVAVMPMAGLVNI